MDPWWSEATKLPFATQDGGAYIGGPFRGVIHTTEFKYYTPSTKDYYGKFDPPHFTLVMEGDDAKFYQHFPITSPPARWSTTRAPSTPTSDPPSRSSLAWTAAEIADLPEAMLERLWDWMRWVETQTGVKSWQYATFVGEGDGKGYNSSSRMSDDEWIAFNGWCGHQHVPGQLPLGPGEAGYRPVAAGSRGPAPRHDARSRAGSA